MQNPLLDAAVLQLWESKRIQTTLILVVYQGAVIPQHSAAMLRSPAPRTGIEIDLVHSSESLARTIVDNFESTPSLHDGAIMLNVSDKPGIVSVEGWSYRLFPPQSDAKEYENRGSAFNSAIHFSSVEGVFCIYYVSVSRPELLHIASGIPTRLARHDFVPGKG